ncbi:MAG: hypothetical protein ACWGMZ_06495 [Thermoguttaceae bacterium]
MVRTDNDHRSRNAGVKPEISARPIGQIGKVQPLRYSAGFRLRHNRLLLYCEKAGVK